MGLGENPGNLQGPRVFSSDLMPANICLVKGAFDMDARWSHFDFLMMLHESGEILSPLWGFPYFVAGCVILDWLQLVGKGVAFFCCCWLMDWVVHNALWGPNQEKSLAALCASIKIFMPPKAWLIALIFCGFPC